MLFSLHIKRAPCLLLNNRGDQKSRDAQWQWRGRRSVHRGQWYGRTNSCDVKVLLQKQRNGKAQLQYKNVFHYCLFLSTFLVYLTPGDATVTEETHATVD